MRLSRIRLSDLADVKSGGSAPQDPSAFSSEGNPFIRAGSLPALLNGHCESGFEKITPDTARSYKLTLFPEGTVIFAKSGMSATKGYVHELKQPCYLVSHLAALIPNDPTDSRFIVRALEKFPPSQLIRDPAYPSIRLSDIKSMEVLAPRDRENRLKIAAVLDEADALRYRRQRGADWFNTLNQAIFYEMFGDPTSNPKGWPLGTIRDLLKEVKYGTSKKANSEGVGMPVLRMGNITYQGGLDISDMKHVELTERERPKYTAEYGDILFNRTNSKELVGKTCVFDMRQSFALAGYLIRARVNEKANPYYVSAYLNSKHGKTKLRNMCKNISGMANINAQEFQDIPICVPPKELQDEFANKYDRIKSQKAVYMRHLETADRLFRSLQQRAFRGDL